MRTRLSRFTCCVMLDRAAIVVPVADAAPVLLGLAGSPITSNV